MEAKPSNREKLLSATEMKHRIASSLDSIKRLKELCQTHLSDPDGTHNESTEQVLSECSRLKTEIEKAVSFCDTASKKTDAVNKLLKVERKKRWKLKKRRLERVRSSFYRSMVAERNRYGNLYAMRCRQIDLWKKEREKQNEEEVEEERKQTLIYDKQLEIQRLKRERFALQKLFCSIHELCTERLLKLEKQGYRPESRVDPIEQGLLKAAQKDVDNYAETVVSRKKRKEW